MVTYRNEVSHEWSRRHALRQFRAGLVSRESICDADFLLVTASRYHGEPSGRRCPVCDDDDLRTVQWVYGDEIGRVSGSARSDEEIEQLVAAGRVFTVHTVEVCPECKWNHLLRAVTAEAA